MTTKKAKILLVVLIIYFFSIYIIDFVSAAQEKGGQDSGIVCIPNPLNPSTDSCSAESNQSEYTDPRVIIGQGIKTILGIIGSVALTVFIYGGFLWLTSGGSETRIKKGKDVILWATLGLVIIFAAYAIVNFFLGGGFIGAFFI